MPNERHKIRIEAEVHRQKLTTHFHSQDKPTTFTPDSITLQTEIVLSRIIVDADGCKPKFQQTPKKRPQLKSKGLGFKEIQMALHVQMVKC